MSQTPFRQRAAKPVPVATKKLPGNSWEVAAAAFLDNGRPGHPDRDPNRKLSQATLDNYWQFLLGKRTEKFRKEQGITIPAEMTDVKLQKFNTELQDAGAASGTIGSYHRCIKNFVGFCIRKGYGGDKKQLEGLGATLKVKGVKIKEPEMTPFTDAEKAQMRTVLADRPRDLMLVNLLLATGARLAEVAALTIDPTITTTDMPNNGLIFIREGKGGKDRHVPLTEGVRVQLVRYVAKVRPKDAASNALFLTNRADGNGAPKPLTTSAIQSLMKRLSTETGIHVNPHKFRHSFATDAINHGVDLFALKKALGHSSLEMVNRYTHRNTADLQKAFAGWKD